MYPIILFGLGIVILFIVVLARHVVRVFRGKYPPLSDDEFLDRCKPGTNRDVALKVRAIIADQLAIPPNEIYPEHRFVEDLKAD